MIESFSEKIFGTNPPKFQGIKQRYSQIAQFYFYLTLKPQEEL
jgi:hypothetical protein